MQIEKNYFILTVLSALASISLILAVQITLDIYRNNKSRSYHELQNKQAEVPAKENIQNAENFQFVYEGVFADVDAFQNNQKIFIPVDYIMNILGVRSRFYHPEDTLILTKQDQEFRFNVAKDKLNTSNGKEYSVPSFFRSGHIYSEASILNLISPMRLQIFEQEKMVFTFPVFSGMSGMKETDFKELLLHKKDGLYIMNLKDLNQNLLIPVQESGKVIYSKANEAFFWIRYGEQINLVNQKKAALKQDVLLTKDAKNFYYQDPENKDLVCLDLEFNERYRFKDMHKAEAYIARNHKEVISFYLNSKIKKILFVDREKQTKELLVENAKGEFLIGKNVSLSPDETKLSYQLDKNFVVADLKNLRNEVVFTEVQSAVWVTKDKILLNLGQQRLLFNFQKGTREWTAYDMQYLGQAKNGVFYKSDNRVFLETPSETKLIMETQINIQVLMPYDNQRNFILIPDETSDAIYIYEGGEFNKIATKSKFINQENCKNFIQLSPQNKYLSILELEGSFNALRLVNLKNDFQEMRFILDIRPEEIEYFQMQWLHENMLLCYAKDKFYVLFPEEKNKILSWGDENAKIVGLLKN